MGFTKRTILISILIVACCVAVSVGITFAFFAESMTSASNKVQSGNFDVDFGLLNKDTNQWTSLNHDSTPIFNYQYFERGYTDVKVLKVENRGDLALKWEARIIFRGERSELSDAINVYLLQSKNELSYPDNRGEIDTWGTPVTLTYFIDNVSNILTGTLEAGETAYFAIALQMRADATDQYLGLTLGEFDFQIAAIQATVENDFFGNDYDKDAGFSCPHIDTYINVVQGANEETNEPGIQHIVCKDCKALILEEPCYFVITKYAVQKLVNGYTNTNIVVPNTYCDVQITSISSNAFQNIQDITSVTIPGGVKSIGINAFYGCSSLTSVELPDGVTSIGAFAFQNCSSLTDIEIPSSVKSIANYAFKGCGSLKSIAIPEGIKTIDLQTFQNCISLENVDLPNSLTSIGQQAFQGCINLKNINIPANVTKIGALAFAQCSSLTAIEFSDVTTSIGKQAFYGCSNLTSVEIPTSTTSIGMFAFSGCKKLTSIIFQNLIGWYAENADATVRVTILEADLADPTTAATYLKSTYGDFYWSCTEQIPTE